jgi:hypothetical protein
MLKLSEPAQVLLIQLSGVCFTPPVALALTYGLIALGVSPVWAILGGFSVLPVLFVSFMLLASFGLAILTA